MPKKYPTYKPLSRTDYLLFNEMITRIRDLENAATVAFFIGKSDRKDMAELVGDQADLIQKTVWGDEDAWCGYPYCSATGVCKLCLVNQARANVQVAVDEYEVNHP